MLRPLSSLLLVALCATLAGAAETDYLDQVRNDAPVGWWRFEEEAKTEGALASDSSGNRYTGVFKSGVESAAGVPGVGGRSARFDGDRALVEIPYRDRLRSQTFSIEFWFRSKQAFDRKFWPGSAALVSTATNGPGSSDWVITAASQRDLDEGRLLAETGPAGAPQDLYLNSLEGDPLNDDHWHHVVLTRTAEGGVKLFVDGIVHASGSDGGGNVLGDRAIQIGGEAIHPGGAFLRGEMDEVALYDRALPAVRVRAHYDSVKPNLPPRPVRRAVAGAEVEIVPAEPRTVLSAEIATKAARHWAFQPIEAPPVPDVAGGARPRNAIDRFVLARLEKAGRQPAARAGATVLLRRAHFDLLGLPPGRERVLAFEKDPAWEALVEELLASPHYGERYARHWLDVVRYADSAGYELDNYYYHAAHYRDYVIRSFNADKPFDRFIREQLAADHLFPDAEELRFATGFFTVGPYAEEGGIARPERVEYQRLTDAADTTGEALLGLSYGCARCHDHKYDPLTHYDYFALQAILGSGRIVKLDVEETRGKSAEEKRKGALLHAIANRDTAPVTRLRARGELDQAAGSVLPGLPDALPGGGVFEETEPQDFKARRSRLADWVVAPSNPLTARVLANRVWMWHFGEPLVATPNDFGTQGARPTHPELLDYLAGYLIESGWSLKALHRLIMQSATYQMDSRHTARPGVGLLDRYPRHRLEAEAIWDNLLSVSGELNPEMFGPAVFPPIDPQVLKAKLNAKWQTPADRSQWARRGIYVVSRRSLSYPFFESFNATPAIVSCARRDRTVVSPQALTLLNNQIPEQLAAAFAERLRRECGDDRGRQIERGWRLAFARAIGDEEKRDAEAYLSAGASLSSWCLALFNANEFIYID